MPTSPQEHVVYVLRHGTRETSRSDVFLNYGQYGEDDGPHTVDYFLWAIVHDGRTTVVDTGFADRVAKRRDRVVLHDPVELLEETLRIKADDVTDVVVTHCHYDHIGNVRRFPNARVHIASAELDFVRNGMMERRLCGHFTEQSEVEDLESVARAGRLSPVQGETTLTPGITLIPVGGHTPGQLMVEVATGQGTVLLASDALHFFEELDRDMPFVSSMNVPDTYRAFDLIRHKLEDGQVAHLVPGHDSATLDRLNRINHDVGWIGIRYS